MEKEYQQSIKQKILNTFDSNEFLNKIRDIESFVNTELPKSDIMEKKLHDLFPLDKAICIHSVPSNAFYDSDITTFYLKNSNGLAVILAKETNEEILNHPDSPDFHLILANGLDSEEIISPEMSSGSYEKQYKIIKQPEFMTIDEQMIRVNDYPELYLTLKDSEQINTDIIKSTANGIFRHALYLNQSESEYSNISPNGGYDIKVKSIADHLLHQLEYFKEYPDILKETKTAFMYSKEGRSYVMKELNTIQKELEIIEHKSDYDQIKWLKHNLSEFHPNYRELAELNMDEITDKIGNIHKEIDNSIKHIKELEMKKTHFWNRNKTGKAIEELTNKIDSHYEEIESLNKLIDDKESVSYYLKEIADIERTLPHPSSKIDQKIFLQTGEKLMENLKELEEFKKYNPYEKCMNISVDIKQQNLTETKNQLKELNEVLKKIVSDPDTYDTRISLSVDDKTYISDQFIDETDFKFLSPLLDKGKDTAILELTSQIINVSNDFRFDSRINTLEKLSEQINTLEVENLNIQIETTLSPAM